MSDDTTSVVMLGTGNWAVSNHLPWLHRRPDVRVVSAFDPNEERLSRVCAKFGISHAAQSVDDALEREPDAVIVASPAAAHAEQVRAALGVDAHVLCEKPFTIEPAEAWSLAGMAVAKQRALIISHGWNYIPLVRDGRELLRSVGIGRLEQVTVHMASYVREVLTVTTGRARGYSADPATWTDSTLSGGGYAPAQLSHAVALLLSLTDDRARRVTALTKSDASPVDLHDAALVEYRSGAIGGITGASCWPPTAAVEAREAWPPHQVSIRLYGSEGQFCLDLERDEVWLRRERDDILHSVDAATGAGRYVGEGPLYALMGAAQGRDEWRRDTPDDLGPRTVEVIAAIARSAQTSAAVDISDAGLDPEPEPRT